MYTCAFPHEIFPFTHMCLQQDLHEQKTNLNIHFLL